MNIIYQILEQIQQDKYYAVSREMEIAKGKYKIPQSKAEKMEQIKRRMIFLIKK